MLGSSGIKHLEEIKNAGLRMPAVNQIEACSIAYPLLIIIKRSNLYLYVAAPSVPAAAYRGLLSCPRNRFASVLPDSARANG